MSEIEVRERYTINGVDWVVIRAEDLIPLLGAGARVAQGEEPPNYPTPEAYEAACKALEKWRARAEKAERERDTALDAAEAFAESMEGWEYVAHLARETLRHARAENTELVEARKAIEAERDEWMAEHERALLCWRTDLLAVTARRDEARAEIARLTGVLSEIAKRPAGCPPDCDCNASRARAALAGEGRGT